MSTIAPIVPIPSINAIADPKSSESKSKSVGTMEVSEEARMVTLKLNVIINLDGRV